MNCYVSIQLYVVRIKIRILHFPQNWHFRQVHTYLKLDLRLDDPYKVDAAVVLDVNLLPNIGFLKAHFRKRRSRSQ